MRSIYKIGIFSMFLLFVFSKSSLAQNDGLRFEHIDIGESRSTITAILQDSRGYIWFGTASDGLIKYDGYTYTRYRFDPFDSNSLSQNLIYTIWEDKLGSIWVGTFEGLCRFERSTDKFTCYRPLPAANFRIQIFVPLTKMPKV